MQVYVVGKMNPDSGKFFYLHIFRGHKTEDNTLIVDDNKLVYSFDNSLVRSSYKNMSRHEEQDLEAWLQSIIWRVFSDQITLDGEWYITL